MEKEALIYYIGNCAGILATSITLIIMTIFNPKGINLSFFIILTIISSLGFILFLVNLIKKKKRNQ